MVSFFVIDVALLVLFALFVGLFLHYNKKNIHREGLLILYKTPWGIKLINRVGTKYKKTLTVLSYVAVILGFILMGLMLLLLFRIVAIYLFDTAAVRAIKIPPIMPLIPYLPQMFELTFLPPFYFVYWIVILAAVAIPHEFFHGIFAKRWGVDTKTTGFGFFPFFLPVFLAAFVELDERVMQKKPRFQQMSVLAAGTFANVLTAIFFFFVLAGFFTLAFTPTAVMYDSYAYNTVSFSDITSINGILERPQGVSDILDLSAAEGVIEIDANGQTYLAYPEDLIAQENRSELLLYFDSPAMRLSFAGPILSIDGEPTRTPEELSTVLSRYAPGDRATVTIFETPEESYDQSLVFGEHPERSGDVWLGITFFDRTAGGVTGAVYSALTSFRDPHVYYEEVFPGWSLFMYNMLWWMILICISVALVNMIPMGIFDGGRFFYLAVWSVTGKEKWGRNAFKWITQFFLLLLAVIMLAWAFALFF